MSPRVTLLAVTLLASSVLPAQQRVRVDPDIRKGVVTLNPFAVFAEYLAGDAEFKTAPAVTFGVGGSISSGNFDGYGALEAKVRYYPGEKALQGFSVGLTAGFVTAREANFDIGVPPGTTRRVARPSIGTELGYQWIVGPSSRFVVVTGLGVKRLLGEERNVDPLSIPLVPTGRLAIGFAF